MTEFWVASGHHLTRLRRDGWLDVTDALLLAYLARPEIAPPPEACAAERALHDRLRADPRGPVAAAEIATLADADARENWTHLIGFRDRLLAAGSVEGAYLAMARGGDPPPPLFLDHLAQLSLRNALDGCGDPFVLRAAELFFRPQRGRAVEGALHLADAEVVAAIEAEKAQFPLTAMFGLESLDVMSEATAASYWSRSDAHAMALNFGGDARSRAGLAAAVAAFVRHMLGVDAEVEPLTAVEEPDLRWYVGLDAEGTAIGDALWRGAPAARDRLIGLFRLTVRESGVIDPRLEGRPVYLLLGMSRDGVVRMKPQNLLTGLPLAAPAPA